MKKRWALIVAAVLLAGDAAATELLTWEACIQEVSSSNADLKAAKASLKALEYQKRGAYSNFFPQLSASFSLNFGTGSATQIGTGGTIATDGAPGMQLLTAVSAKQNIFSGFLDKGRVDQATANEEVTRLNLVIAEAQVSYNLKSAFAAMLYAQNAIELTNDIIQRRRANLKQVQLRYESGRENKGSLLLSKAYFIQAEYDELLAKDALVVARAQLANVLGREAVGDVAVTGSIPMREPLAENDIDLHELVLQTPVYKSARAQEKLAKATMTMARAPFFPVANLSASVGNSLRDNQVNHRWLLGADISLPFFSGGKDYYAIKSAEELIKSSQFAIQSIIMTNVAKLRQAHVAFLQAVQRVEVDLAFVDATTTRAKIAKEKYNNGLLSFEDWDIIENDLISRQRALLQTELNRAVAEAAWEQALGKGAIH